MPESPRTRLARHLFNLAPVYRGTGGRVRYIASDWSEVRVEVPLSWRTRNYVGTIYGGSLYGAVDPFYMIMLIERLGPGYVVWDREATIRFLRPGRTTLAARFAVDDGELSAIRAALETTRSVDRRYEIELADREGNVHATVEKVVYVRRRDGAGADGEGKPPAAAGTGPSLGRTLLRLLPGPWRRRDGAGGREVRSPARPRARAERAGGTPRALLLLLALAGCRDWRARVEPSRAAAEPEQVALDDSPPIEYQARGYSVRLRPRATYRITGYAVDTSTELLDEWDFVVPMDVALVWGPAADPAVLRRLSFHLSDRYVSYRWQGADPLPRPVLETHIANNHLIPASEEVRREMKRIRTGDLVTLEGKLVDLEIRDASGALRRRALTSLRRDDVGSGACEQIWVESVARE